MNPRLRVLVVDDSAFARKVIREVLSRDPEIEVVGIARDGLEALEKIAELKPDVVTLDLVMPDLDGISVLKALPPGSSTRILIVSTSHAETDLAMEALSLGAIDVVTKPTPLPTDRLYELSTELVKKVKALREATPLRVLPPIVPAPLATPSTHARLLVIGTSTGGPQALTRFFESLPANFPLAIAIALHIPDGYTRALAARLTRLGRTVVNEAVDGEELKPGQAVIAPGGQHLRVRARGATLFTEVSLEPRESLFHPSVNILFESAANAVGADAIGIVLTGMGDDGTVGAGSIRGAGGRVVAESQSSCVVYGMPRSVIEAGHATRIVPLELLAQAVVEMITAPSDSHT